MTREFRGIVVEESLDDNRVINNLEVRKVRVTGHEEPANRWHMYEVTASKEEINELSKHIVGDWYMHFWRGTQIIAIFRERGFEFDYEDKSTWSAVREFGHSLGLLER